MAAPQPEMTVPYRAYGNSESTGKLCVFGKRSSPVIALLCPGFADDHTVFLPFARALSEGGDVLAGVMCLPGYDDRPEDGAAWRDHPRVGFSFDETARAVREAAKALGGVSTHENPKLVGVFHDWGVAPGSMWAKQLEQEARDDPSVPLKPDKMVFFDVLPKCQGDNSGGSPRQALYCTYMFVFAIGSWLQTHVSRHLAAAFVMPCFFLLAVSGLFPLYDFDWKTTESLYGGRKPGLLRVVYMTYMYRKMVAECWSRKTLNVLTLHEDLRATPVLYLYGKEKRCMYHSSASLATLEREEAEGRSLSRAVGVEGAGHFLYVPGQKAEECRKHVLDFVRAENTFAASS